MNEIPFQEFRTFKFLHLTILGLPPKPLIFKISTLRQAASPHCW